MHRRPRRDRSTALTLRLVGDDGANYVDVMSVQWTRDGHRICWLASYPKSGNTWLRFLLTNLLLGPQADTTGMERRVPDLHDATDLSQLLTHDRAFVKSHLMWQPGMPLGDATAGFVYVVRNPLDVLVSNLNYLFLQSYDQLAPLAETERQAFADRYVDTYLEHRGDPRWLQFGMGSWTQHEQSWSSANETVPGLTLRYENLLARPTREVARICEFVGLERTPEQIEGAVRDSSFERMREIEEQEIRERQSGFFYRPNFAAGHRQGFRFMNRGREGLARRRLRPEQLQRAEQAFEEPMRQLGYASTAAGAGCS
ncbi:MAG: sulfotransferase domain-containing protein [bacterium]|nr:sulfotransferase domain-containing protein [bacterium]